MRNYARAVSLLLSLATPLYQRCMTAGGEPDIEDAAFEHWFTCRRIATKWMCDRSTAELVTADREALWGALRFAHELAHPGGRAPGVERCDCMTAKRLQSLALLQVADATNVELGEAMGPDVRAMLASVEARASRTAEMAVLL